MQDLNSTLEEFGWSPEEWDVGAKVGGCRHNYFAGAGEVWVVVAGGFGGWGVPPNTYHVTITPNA